MVKQNLKKMGVKYLKHFLNYSLQIPLTKTLSWDFPFSRKKTWARKTPPLHFLDFLHWKHSAGKSAGGEAAGEGGALASPASDKPAAWKN